MTKKYKTITETVTKDGDDLRGNLDIVIKILQEWKKEYGGDAYLDIESWENGYDIGIGISISYSRSETDKERDTRLAKIKKMKERAKELRAKADIEIAKKEKIEYIRLKEKYEHN